MGSQNNNVKLSKRKSVLPSQKPTASLNHVKMSFCSKQNLQGCTSQEVRSTSYQEMYRCPKKGLSTSCRSSCCSCCRCCRCSSCSCSPCRSCWTCSCSRS